MAIVIKEMRIRTVVEKKIITGTDIPAEVYLKIRDQVLEELSFSKHIELRKKKER